MLTTINYTNTVSKNTSTLSQLLQPAGRDNDVPPPSKQKSTNAGFHKARITIFY
jgi:hypothetical protein